VLAEVPQEDPVRAETAGDTVGESSAAAAPGSAHGSLGHPIRPGDLVRGLDQGLVDFSEALGVVISVDPAGSGCASVLCLMTINGGLFSGTRVPILWWHPANLEVVV
jgi:hypothetical protein